MTEKNSPAKSGFTLDWLVRGVLTRAGDALDKLTGRDWRPASSLATSELLERLKLLLDTEARDQGPKGIYVPHNIKLKMQWDKFSTDSDATVTALRTEILAAAVDHINDRRYYTYAPLNVEIKPDYFTTGVKLQVGFDEFADEADTDAELEVNFPGDSDAASMTEAKDAAERDLFTYTASFVIDGVPQTVQLDFPPGARLSVGRTRSNELALPDSSVSKLHASLTINADNKLIVSDTGSTNGTLISGERIAHGKTVVVGHGSKVVFGNIEVTFDLNKPFDGTAAETASEASGPAQVPQTETALPFTTSRIEFIKAIPTGEEPAAASDDEKVRTV